MNFLSSGRVWEVMLKSRKIDFGAVYGRYLVLVLLELPLLNVSWSFE